MDQPNLPQTPIADRPGQPPRQRNFWQTRMAQDVLPFATSVVLHLTIILLAILLVPPIVKNFNAGQHREEVLVPDVRLAEGDQLGGVENPGLGDDPTRAAAQDKDLYQKESMGLSQRKSESVNPYDSTGGGEGSLISRGPGTGPGKNGGSGDPFGDGSGQAKWGLPGGGSGIGPESKLLGTGGNVKSVVFVCDFSGGMMDGNNNYTKADILKKELLQQIGAMQAIQSFNIILYEDTEGDRRNFVCFSGKLLAANAGNQSKAAEFIKDQQPHGGDEGVFKALDEAFRENPQLITFLTDGRIDTGKDFVAPTNEELLAYFRKKNANHTFHVNTVQLLVKRSEEQDIRDVIDTYASIAKENGGKFTKFILEDLGK